MKLLILVNFIITIVLSMPAHSVLKNKFNKHTIRVAVIDTGFDFKSTWQNIANITRPILCEGGVHRDFTGANNINDNHGHGTHITGIIAKYAEHANYCLIIIKNYDPEIVHNERNTIQSLVKSMEYAIQLNVDIINYSGGGDMFSLQEYNVVKKVLNKGILLVTAAGNERVQIDYHVLKVQKQKQRHVPYYIHRKTGHITTQLQNSFFPASYDSRIIAVISASGNEKHDKFSNYGAAFIHSEPGKKVLSILPDNKIGYETGTSQATAIRTGKILKLWQRK